MEAKNFNNEFSKGEKTLRLLGAEKYDTCEDIAMLQLQVERTMEKTRTQWKTYDQEQLVTMIKNQVAAELCKLEERKQVRRN